MRALKGLVIGMGVMIVAGLMVLGYGIVQKASDPGFRFFKPSATAAAPRPAEAFGNVEVKLPEGCSVVEMRPGDGRLYLRTDGRCDGKAIVVIDVVSGAVLGTIDLIR